MNHARREKCGLAQTLVLGLVLLGCGGCQLYHNLGTGVRYDPPVERAGSEKSKRVRDILVDVTTGPSGAVTLVQFKRSSESADLDAYIADSVRANFTGTPNTRSTVELTYSGEKGFSDPKVIATAPAGGAR